MTKFRTKLQREKEKYVVKMLRTKWRTIIKRKLRKKVKYKKTNDKCNGKNLRQHYIQILKTKFKAKGKTEKKDKFD